MTRLSDPPDPAPISAALANHSSKWRDVPWYVPTRDLEASLELAIELQQPLLITGPPGCGKTSAAYWAAWRLRVDPADLIHVQVQSSSTAQLMRYEFDAVRYFRDAQLATIVAQRSAAQPSSPKNEVIDREPFMNHGPLWSAFDASQKRRVVLLFDEIDKAGRDFPNDLLHEFDAKSFAVPDLPRLNQRPTEISAKMGRDGLALIVLTSNGERSLPDAFLRRCLYHHVTMDPAHMRAAVERHVKGRKIGLEKPLLDVALDRFDELRSIPGLNHQPGLSELLVWLRAMAHTPEAVVALRERRGLGELGCLGALLKHADDMAAILAT